MSQEDPRLECPRCGGELIMDREVTAILEVVLTEIDRAKQRWPLGVTGDLRELTRKMRCRIGACAARPR